MEEAASPAVISGCEQKLRCWLKEVPTVVRYFPPLVTLQDIRRQSSKLEAVEDVLQVH